MVDRKFLTSILKTIIFHTGDSTYLYIDFAVSEVLEFSSSHFEMDF